LREVAPAKTVRVDANEAWTTKEEALRNLESLAQTATSSSLSTDAGLVEAGKISFG